MRVVAVFKKGKGGLESRTPVIPMQPSHQGEEAGVGRKRRVMGVRPAEKSGERCSESSVEAGPARPGRVESERSLSRREGHEAKS